MNTDYLDAHKRHWEDAELLKEVSRLANADHLYGMSAECGLKRLMICFGMEVDKDGVPTPKDKKHANVVWNRYETYRSGHAHGAAYALPPSNPFGDWDVNQRYSGREHFEAAGVVAHRNGAQVVMDLIAKARKAGLI